jgi:hypothetical protein
MLAGETAEDTVASDTVLERHAEQSSQQHQCRQASSSSSNSSSKAVESQPAAAKGSRKVAKHKLSQQQQQQPEGRPDVSARPDVMQALTKERKRRAFIGMLK